MAEAEKQSEAEVKAEDGPRVPALAKMVKRHTKPRERPKGILGKIMYTYHWVKTLVFTPIGAYKQSNLYASIIQAILLLAEWVLCNTIIAYVPYTEIDWKAYMQEVEGWLGGVTDYSKLKGDTGPLVYPAGFLYVFAGLRVLSQNGLTIRIAQYHFMYIYLFVQCTVLMIYKQTRRMPPLAMVLICLSKRLHSIFVLRLFNDCLAIAFVYVAICYFCFRRWRIGCLFYSLAVSIKMNILLYSPGLLLLLLEDNSLFETVICLSICASVQLVLAYPFLSTYPLEYLKGAFDFGRVFMFKWTVNYKFLPEDIFRSKRLALALLACTVLGMIVFVVKWRRSTRKARIAVAKFRAENADLSDPNVDPRIFVMSADYIVATLFISNFIGVAFARSLHYQFYSWYFHQLPYLAWFAGFHWLASVVLVAAVEIAYNVYPATPLSSLVLQAVHLVFLVGIFAAKVPFPFEVKENPKLVRRKKRVRKPIGPELPPDLDLPPFGGADGETTEGKGQGSEATDEGEKEEAAEPEPKSKSGRAKKVD